MCFSNILLTTQRFNQDWSDESDSDPPPGYDFAVALGNAFAAFPECSVPSQPVNYDDWEHSNWFFWVTFQKLEFRIDVACVMSPETHPGVWHIAFTRQWGIIRSLFRRSKASDIPDDFRRVAESVLTEVTGANDMRWVDDDEAIDAIIPR